MLYSEHRTLKNELNINKKSIMQKQLKLILLALCATQITMAQNNVSLAEDKPSNGTDETQFVFSESQLGEDEDMAQNVTILSSNSDLYANNIGYQFSPVRFRYRAFNQKYNDVYINGMSMNDMETGQFRFSLVGGLNNQTRGVETALPFEDNQFALSNMAGSSNYNFRSGALQTGSKASLLFTNRNYQMRAMYTYNSGFNKNGWAWSANLTYRGATYETQKINPAFKGTFYNALSYFFAVQKLLGNHSLSFATWGNPTERANTGGSTDEMYWLADNNYYNPYWGYQNGKIRNSRIVNDFAPSAVFTWDWTINDRTKLTTSLGGRYSMYKSTKLNYNGSDNPQPDYWKLMPSNKVNVWDPNAARTESEIADWAAARDYLMASEANRQIDFDKLYYCNQNIPTGKDAMYFIEAKRNDALTLQLNSILNHELDPYKHLTVGFGLGSNHARHYATMEDLLGAATYHNINSYCVGEYATTADEVQYDLNNPNKVVKEGDVFRYDYYINVTKANFWSQYSVDVRRLHFMVGARTSYNIMERDGKMRNGLAKNNSYGKSGKAHFMDGGLKTALTYNMGKGHALSLGLGIDSKAPTASSVFQAPEINNDFCTNLHNELVFSSNMSYQMRTSIVNLNLNAYYSHMNDVTEWQNFYYDNVNSFTYLSMTGIAKDYYGLELGAKVKLTSVLDLKALGTISEAKYKNNAHARFMYSTSGTVQSDLVFSKGMREGGTPLTAASLGLSYHNKGWFIDLSGNYYDRIYLSWSPCMRYLSYLTTEHGLTNNSGGITSDGEDNTVSIEQQAAEKSPAQAKGKGGFMLDASIGKSIYLKKGSLSINLSLNNILNNTNITTGGYEQSRSNFTVTKTTDENGIITATRNNERTYNFQKNPKKFYALGTNGMLNITWRF